VLHNAAKRADLTRDKVYETYDPPLNKAVLLPGLRFKQGEGGEGQDMSIVSVGSQYGADLITLAYQPQRIITRQSNSKSLDEPACFLGVSVIITTLFWTILLRCPWPEIYLVVAKTGMSCFCAILLVTTGIPFTWRLLGGRMTYLEFFGVYAYFAGALLVGWTVVVLVMFATWSLLDIVQPAYRWSAFWGEFLAAIAVIEWQMQPAREWFRQRQALGRWRSCLAQALLLA
jgi:hypothetical protein